MFTLLFIIGSGDGFNSCPLQNVFFSPTNTKHSITCTWRNLSALTYI